LHPFLFSFAPWFVDNKLIFYSKLSSMVCNTQINKSYSSSPWFVSSPIALGRVFTHCLGSCPHEPNTTLNSQQLFQLRAKFHPSPWFVSLRTNIQNTAFFVSSQTNYNSHSQWHTDHKFYSPSLWFVSSQTNYYSKLPTAFSTSYKISQLATSSFILLWSLYNGRSISK